MRGILSVTLRSPSQIRRLPGDKTEAELKVELEQIKAKLAELAPEVDRLRERRSMIERALR